MGCFSLASGALLHWVETTLKCYEGGILKQLLPFFSKGDVILGDRGYCSYVNIALLQKQDAEAVMRLHQRRFCDYSEGKKLGPHDRLVTWQRPQRQSPFSKEQWAQLPASLTLRMVRIFVCVKGFRTQQIDLITTLIDPLEYTQEDLAELYFRRWAIELWFRDIKTSMKMESVRCRTPEMVLKEIQMFFIACNLIRGLMQQAAGLYLRDLHRLSFKGTVDTIRQYQNPLNATRRKPREQERIIDEMILLIAEETVPLREHRYEPRVVKRRPKPYPRMTKPRHVLKASLARKYANSNRR